jgi:hypothetical protein
MEVYIPYSPLDLNLWPPRRKHMFLIIIPMSCGMILVDLSTTLVSYHMASKQAKLETKNKLTCIVSLCFLFATSDKCWRCKLSKAMYRYIIYYTTRLLFKNSFP